MSKMKKVTDKLASDFDLDNEAVAYWNSLSGTQRSPYYIEAVADVRHTTWQENRYGLITGGYRGRGASLATAVDLAWNDSTTMRQRRQAKAQADRESYEAETFPCVACGKMVARRDAYVVSVPDGYLAQCKQCLTL